MKKNIKVIFILFIISYSNFNAYSQTSIYTNDMDYVIGDTKQAFITDKITTEDQADNLLKGFAALQVNGIRIPIFAEGLTPNKPMFDYFYSIAVAAGFPIFANPAQSSGGHRIACGVLNTTEDLCNVKNNTVTDNILINRIKAFALEYQCTWINPFNEDGRTDNPYTVSQINTIYSSLQNNLNGAELIGSGAWGLPAGIDVLANTNIADYITVATTHNLGFHHSRWSNFIALADAEGLPVWDSEVNHFDKFDTGTRLEKALENGVDGLVLYNSWNTIGLGDGSISTGAIDQMLLYLKEYSIPIDPVRTNIALTGTATQSSTNSNWGKEAHLAIDGDTNGNYGGGSVTVTNDEENPWWQVDLGSEQVIGEIKVFNRTDGCCAARMSNFTVSVIDADATTVYTKTYTTHPAPSVIADTGGVKGQIIKIQLNVTNALTLAEVQVFAPEEALSTTITENIKVNLYPNPVTDKLTASTPNAVFKQYTIYSINGQEITSHKVNAKEIEIYVDKLSNGIYLLKLEGNKFSETYKIIKN